jgi:predicted anti-sigma-YlaC factor YlaD
MKISCEIIRDLLPLYHDGVCSIESKALVEEHLTECESCSRELIAMDTELPVTNEESQWDDAKSVIQLSRKWKKGMLTSLLKGILSATIVFVLLLVILYLFMDIKIVANT